VDEINEALPCRECTVLGYKLRLEWIKEVSSTPKNIRYTANRSFRRCHEKSPPQLASSLITTTIRFNTPCRYLVELSDCFAVNAASHALAHQHRLSGLQAFFAFPCRAVDLSTCFQSEISAVRNRPPVTFERRNPAKRKTCPLTENNKASRERSECLQHYKPV